MDKTTGTRPKRKGGNKNVNKIIANELGRRGKKKKGFVQSLATSRRGEKTARMFEENKKEKLKGQGWSTHWVV